MNVGRIIIGLALCMIILAIAFARNGHFKNELTTKFLARTGVFAAISIILYIVPALNLALPIFPMFLKIHFDEIPAFIAGFAYGPLSAFFVIAVKTIVKLPMSETLCVGELADFLYSCAFVLPAAIVYHKRNNIKGALTGIGLGTLVQLLVSTLFTTFVMLKFYMFVMGLPEQVILGMCQEINPNVTDLKWPFLFMVSLPFNALKDVIVIVVTFLLYKRLHKLIDRISAQKN